MKKPTRIKTIFLSVLGFMLLGIGAVGLVIPVWPTTPFIILSAACFSCSPKLREKIMRISFFKEHIENYKYRQGLSLKTVCISLCYLWVMLLISAFLISTYWVALLLCGVGIAVTLHIVLMARGKSKQVKPFQAKE